MKRILSLILVLVMVFLMFGCNQNEETSPPSESSDIETPSETQGTEATEPIKVVKAYDNEPFESCFGTENITKSSFESVIGSSTNVIKANYKGMVKSGKHYLLDFEVIENLYATSYTPANNSIITVFYSPRTLNIRDENNENSYSICTNTIDYAVNSDYLLFLCGVSSMIYLKDVVYRPEEETLVIPLDENGSPDVSNSKMYGQSLTDSIKEESIRTAEDGEAFLEMALLNVGKSDVIFTVSPPPAFETFEEACDDVEYVLRVKILGNETVSSSQYYKSEYSCQVIEAIKGEAEGKIRVVLPTDQIYPGREYIVAVKKYYNKYSVLSPYGVIRAT